MKYHLIVAVKNGTPIVACRKDPATLDKLTKSLKDTDCLACLAKIIRTNNQKPSAAPVV